MSIPGWSTPELAKHYPSYIAACAEATLWEHFSPSEIAVIEAQFRRHSFAQAAAASGDTASRREEWPERQVQREAARRVLADLYPGDVPDQATLPNKELCRAVTSRLLRPVSVDTILRAAGRR